jgi:3-hydroxyacyl-CoA dehydrogenase
MGIVCMSDKVRLTREGEIGIVTVDNPPVNALSAGIPESILETIQEAASKPEIRAIVVIGSGRTFIAGADIHELNDLPILGSVLILQD